MIVKVIRAHEPLCKIVFTKPCIKEIEHERHGSVKERCVYSNL